MVSKKMFHLDVEDTISKLTIDEKFAMLSGIDFWHTKAVSRLGVPSIRMSDGPNGVRGTRFFNGVPAACLPCGTALASTWDKALLQSGGELMGKESIAKGSHILLGPTMNIQRSPLGGRGFESYSEDPFLSGKMGAAVVKGIQSTGVSATIKHFVCNDQEDSRQAISSIVTERALREIYLMPFMITEREARPWAYMTAYNKVNGLHCSENPKLLDAILRKEWGFDGLIMSDWFGTYSAAESIKAGLDLEMPGPPGARGHQVQIALNSGKITEHDIDLRLRNLLNLINKVMKTGIPENAPEKTIDTKETAQKLREIGAASQVLLKNDHNVLPFKKDKSVAVIGPNATFAAYSGGGSASLRPYYAITPLEAIQAQATDVKYALGAAGYKALPLISEVCKTPKKGDLGLIGKVYLDPASSSHRREIDEIYVDTSRVFLVDYKHPKLDSTTFYIDFYATLTPDVEGEYTFGLVVAGTGKLFVDDKLVIDNASKQTIGEEFFGSGSVEEKSTIKLEKGKTYNLRLEFGSGPTMTVKRPGATDVGSGGWRLGLVRVTDPQEEIERAVALAKSVDQVVVVAGLSAEWESEGYDRPHMDLPGLQDALISAVAAANPYTAVVLQSGTPVSMPWAPSVSAIIQSWFGGNETGSAIADVLFGDVNPSGKLPLSFPLRNEDNPAFLNFRNDKGRALYGEDVFVGYRFYEKTKRETRWPFGHGLSYTTFGMKELEVSVAEKNDELLASVLVTNTGKIGGKQTVQLYVKPEAPSVTRPVKELKGFEKVELSPGETKVVEMKLSLRDAVSYWDEQRDAWCMEKGMYSVLVGDSSATADLAEMFEVKESRWWRGL